MSTDSYAEDGVNLTVGSKISKFASSVSRETWPYATHVRINDFARGRFRGPVGYRFVDLPEGCWQTSGSDGIGTKAMLYGSTGYPYPFGAGQDLLAMGTGDLTRYGALPLVFSNVLDVESLGEIESDTYIFFLNLLTGLRDAAKSQGVALIGGETAELGVGVGSDNSHAKAKFNWAGFATGVLHEKAIITGDELAPGQMVVAIRERGLRCNWFSGVRSALKLRFGADYFNHPEAANSILQAIHPSELCDRFLARANGWRSRNFSDRIPVKAIAHITGGGVKEKFAEDVVLQKGLSADLDNLWDPSEIMIDCVNWRRSDGSNFPDSQVYEKCNGGQCVLAVMEAACTNDFIALAKEEGHEAQVCGKILEFEGPQRVWIRSKFGGGDFTYP